VISTISDHDAAQPIPSAAATSQKNEPARELGMRAAELARQLDVPTNRVMQIPNGRRAITGDTALRLAHFFGTTAEFWLNLQGLYEIRLAEQKSGKFIEA
jgi:addiction module HigA family antidote